MKNRLSLPVLIFMSVSMSISAQEKLPSDTFRVVKEYQPILIDADKITFDPEINDTFKLETSLDYSFINKQVPVSFKLQPIAPATIKGEPLVKLYNGYARAGVGNAMLPFGEVYYSNTRSKKFAAGGHVKYLHQKELNNIKGSEMSNAHFGAFGKRFWKRNTLEAALSYDINKLNYYGYYSIPSLFQNELPPSELEQQYNLFKSEFKLKSTKQDSFNLRHEADFHFHNLSNSSSNTEQQFKATGRLSQFVDDELYQLELLGDYNKYDLAQESGIFAIKPQISTIGEKFRVNAGLGIYMNANTDTDFHFYPLAEVKYNVIGDILVPYVGLKGEVRRNSYLSVTTENPFVAENIQLQNSNQKFNIYGGVRGTLSSKVSFNTSVARVKTTDDYLYVKQSRGNEILSKDFYLVYDEIDEVQLKGELVYRMQDKVKIYALGEYFNYSTKVQEEAWHRPEIKISVSGEYNLYDKIIVKADIFYWGSQYAQGVNEVTVSQSNNIIDRTFYTETLAPIVDVNLGFEYRYTKKLSAFIQFNNIGGINYEKYQDYPLQGFNVWGGLTYAF